MRGVPLDNVKEGLRSILSDIREQDKMAIAYFHDDFFKKTGFETDREILRNNIIELKTGGSKSLIYYSVIEAIKWLESIESPKRKILVVISDGKDESNNYTLEDCKSEAKKSGISIFTIGSTSESNESKGYLRNMEDIALSTPDGKYYKISEPEDIKKIIPLIYERIKEEYVLTYFSLAEVNQSVDCELSVTSGDLTFMTEYNYTSPPKIIENAPGVSFWETSEFLYGSIGAGVIIIVLITFMTINIRKKKQFRLEKEEEKRLREEEARENQARFDGLKNEYDEMLNKLENQKEISESDKEKINLLEKRIDDVGKTLPVSKKIDKRRRTMILSAKEDFSSFETDMFPTVIVQSGSSAGNRVQVSANGITIGRTAGDLILPDDTISRSHAKISLVQGRYFIEDLGSTNGTYVNNQKVSQSPLNSGDVIRLGSIELLFQN